MKKYSPRVTKILTARMMFTFLRARCLHTHRHTQDRLDHTLTRLPDTHKSTSDLISPILARYDSKKKKKNFFRMTVEPSYEREGGKFRMMDEPSYGRERVKCVGNVTRGPIM